MDVTESVHFNACYDGKSQLTEANLSRSKDAKGTTVQLAGLILICAACPVISAMAGSLETVLLAYTASILSTSSLVRERRAQAVCASNSHQSRISGITEHPSTRQTTDIFSFLCVATGMAFLGSLVGSSSLEVIRQTLLESYRAERVDLLVGGGLDPWRHRNRLPVCRSRGIIRTLPVALDSSEHVQLSTRRSCRNQPPCCNEFKR